MCVTSNLAIYGVLKKQIFHNNIKSLFKNILLYQNNNSSTLKADSLLLTPLWFFICPVSTWQCSFSISRVPSSVYLQRWQHGKSNAWLVNYTARENRPLDMRLIWIVDLNRCLVSQGFTMAMYVINWDFLHCVFNVKCVGTNMICVNMN